VDIFFRRGDLSRGLPFIPVLEVVGTIRKLGPVVPIDRSSRGVDQRPHRCSRHSRRRLNRAGPGNRAA
jgi:hypothetical protein